MIDGMSITTYNGTQVTTYVEITCGTCGLPFAMSQPFYEARRRDHAAFYCPAGHGRYYTIESDLERARRERDEAQRATAGVRDDLAAERRQHSTTKGQLTRARNRARAGVCIACHRTFANVARHMQTKHPEPTTQNP